MMRALTLSLLVLAVAVGHGIAAEQTAHDEAMRHRVAMLGSVLRCLVCQNQSIADSNAPLARDLKAQIREQVVQGRSDAEILDFMVARYGDFVLYRPPLKATTVILWVGPFAALLIGLVALVLKFAAMRRGRETGTSQAERRRAAELLGLDMEKGRS